MVGEVTTTPVAAMPPKATAAPATKPSPVIETVPPPAAGPAAGERAVTVGAPAANWSATEMGEVPIGLVTVTSTPPCKVVGEEAVMTVGPHTVTAVPAAEPKATVSPGVKFVPVMVTTVAEDAGPVSGESAVKVGAA